jgi:DNA mismatch endonuclease (patch repair protein)
MRANRRISAREKLFRTALWRAGARGYRVQSCLPGRPDIVFPALRLAVFVHGCFWHRCPTCNLRAPVANASFWAQKFEANARRDMAAKAALESQGWEVLAIWEHEIRPDPVPRANELAGAVRQRRATNR